ncbi:dystrophin-like [Stegodyphus dumicola]|uniref:dystrophin-like n=1 Tax=Stegodyphus dumicola TaxID=202533 RepID=UPI0015ACCC32|nr:dystrophin-like [Stegodyphus dumicola]
MEIENLVDLQTDLSSKSMELCLSLQEGVTRTEEAELMKREQKEAELMKTNKQMDKMKEKYAIEPELVEVQEKWEVLSSKIQSLVENHEVDVKRTTIEQLRASPVLLPNSEPGSPRTGDIGTKIRQTRLRIEDLEKSALNETAMQNFDSVAHLEDLLKAFKEKALDTEDHVKQLISDWDVLERKTDHPDQNFTKLQHQMQSLREKWSHTQKLSEDYHRKLNKKILNFSQIEERRNNLYECSLCLMSKLNDAEKISPSEQKVLESEAKKLQKEVEDLQQDAAEYGVSKMHLQKLLKDTTTLLAGISMRIDEIEASREKSVKTVRTQTDKQNVILLQTSNTAIIPDFIAKVNKVREAIAAVNRQLTQPELSGKDFEDFGRQEGSLKAIKDGINALKPNVELVLAEKENVVKKASKSDAVQIERVAEKLGEEWNKLNAAHDERHERWLKAHDVWQGFESDLRSMTSWLVSSDTILAHSRLPNGDLDYERAKMHQEMLQKQVSEKMAMMERLNVIGHKVLEQCSAPDAILLQEQLDSLNKRWKSLVAELAARKAKLEEDKTTLAVVKDEIEDLSLWLKETEMLLCGTPRTTDLSAAKILLGKLKDIEQDIPYRRSSLLTIMLAGTLVNTEEVETLEQRYSKVTSLIPERRKHLECYVRNFSEFEEQSLIEKDWLLETRKKLEDRLALYSAGRTVDEKNIVAQDKLREHHAAVSKLVRQQYELESAAQKASLILPPSVKKNANGLLSEWSALTQILKKLSPYERCPSPLPLETLASVPTNAAIVEEIYQAEFGGIVQGPMGWHKIVIKGKLKVGGVKYEGGGLGGKLNIEQSPYTGRGGFSDRNNFGPTTKRADTIGECKWFIIKNHFRFRWRGWAEQKCNFWMFKGRSR